MMKQLEEVVRSVVGGYMDKVLPLLKSMNASVSLIGVFKDRLEDSVDKLEQVYTINTALAGTCLALLVIVFILIIVIVWKTRSSDQGDVLGRVNRVELSALKEVTTRLETKVDQILEGRILRLDIPGSVPLMGDTRPTSRVRQPERLPEPLN